MSTSSTTLAELLGERVHRRSRRRRRSSVVDDQTLGAELVVGVSRRRGAPWPCIGIPCSSSGSLAADPVDLGVAHDGEQPGARVTAVEAQDRLVGPQHRVLDEVLGVGRIAGDRPRHPVQDLDLGHDIPVERLLLGEVGGRVRHAGNLATHRVGMGEEAVRVTGVWGCCTDCGGARLSSCGSTENSTRRGSMPSSCTWRTVPSAVTRSRRWPGSRPSLARLEVH